MNLIGIDINIENNNDVKIIGCFKISAYSIWKMSFISIFFKNIGKDKKIAG
jgi:hypothetical protein